MTQTDPFVWQNDQTQGTIPCAWVVSLAWAVSSTWVASLAWAVFGAMEADNLGPVLAPLGEALSSALAMEWA